MFPGSRENPFRPFYQSVTFRAAMTPHQGLRSGVSGNNKRRKAHDFRTAITRRGHIRPVLDCPLWLSRELARQRPLASFKEEWATRPIAPFSTPVVSLHPILFTLDETCTKSSCRGLPLQSSFFLRLSERSQQPKLPPLQARSAL